MYYAVRNSYADPDTGYGGFANTWVIAAFKTRRERDEAVERDPAIRPIKRSEIRQYAFMSLRRPRPFSSERYVWRLEDGIWLSRHFEGREIYILDVGEPNAGDIPLYGRGGSA